MSNTNTGGPAFPALPITRESNGELIYQSAGLTMRDYFAAKAMQGICASGPGNHMTNDRISAEAYDIADAMLKAREQ